MDLFGKKKIRELEDRLSKLESIHTSSNGNCEYTRFNTHEAIIRGLCNKINKKSYKTYSTESIKDLTIQEFFDFYFDGKPIKRKEEVDVEYRKGD